MLTRELIAFFLIIGTILGLILYSQRRATHIQRLVQGAELKKS